MVGRINRAQLNPRGVTLILDLQGNVWVSVSFQDSSCKGPSWWPLLCNSPGQCSKTYYFEPGIFATDLTPGLSNSRTTGQNKIGM